MPRKPHTSVDNPLAWRFSPASDQQDQNSNEPPPPYPIIATAVSNYSPSIPNRQSPTSTTDGKHTKYKHIHCSSLVLKFLIYFSSRTKKGWYLINLAVFFFDLSMQIIVSHRHRESIRQRQLDRQVQYRHRIQYRLIRYLDHRMCARSAHGNVKHIRPS